MTGMPREQYANVLPSERGSAPVDSSTLFGSLHPDQINKARPSTQVLDSPTGSLPPWLSALCDSYHVSNPSSAGIASDSPTDTSIDGSFHAPSTCDPVTGDLHGFLTQADLQPKWQGKLSSPALETHNNMISHQPARSLELLSSHHELPIQFEDSLAQHHPPVSAATNHFLPVASQEYEKFQINALNMLSHANTPPLDTSTQLSCSSMANPQARASQHTDRSCQLGHRTGSAPALMNMMTSHSQPAILPPAHAPSLSRAASDFHSLNLAQGLINGHLAPAVPRKSKRWWEILQALHHFPSDTGLAISSVIENAVRAALAEGVDVSITSLLQLAISEFEEGHSSANMRNTALEVLRRFKPADAIDSLSLAFPRTHPSLSAPKRTGAASRPIPSPTTRRPGQEAYVVRHTERGEAQFHDNVAKLKHKPWFELIHDIQKMKPNNGYPIKVNIAAAMLSAQTHPVHRDTRVPVILQQAMSLYARKSCGLTKQKALSTLELTKNIAL